MGRRSFAMRDIMEIYLHWQAGRSLRAIAQSLAVDRKTIRKYDRRSPQVRRFRLTTDIWADGSSGYRNHLQAMGIHHGACV